MPTFTSVARSDSQAGDMINVAAPPAGESVVPIMYGMPPLQQQAAVVHPTTFEATQASEPQQHQHHYHGPDSWTAFPYDPKPFHEGLAYVSSDAPSRSCSTSTEFSYSSAASSGPSTPSKISPIHVESNSSAASRNKRAHEAHWLTLLRERLRAFSNEEILVGVCNALVTLMTRPPQYQCNKASLSNTAVFDSQPLAPQTIYGFLVQFLNSRLCSRECFPLCIVYMERLMAKGLEVTLSNVTRLFVVGALSASKLIDDRYCRNSYYAKLCGMTLAAFNQMELEYCFMHNFKFHVEVEDLLGVYENFASSAELELAKLCALFEEQTQYGIHPYQQSGHHATNFQYQPLPTVPLSHQTYLQHQPSLVHMPAVHASVPELHNHYSTSQQQDHYQQQQHHPYHQQHQQLQHASMLAPVVPPAPVYHQPAACAPLPPPTTWHMHHHQVMMASTPCFPGACTSQYASPAGWPPCANGCAPYLPVP